MSVVSMGVAFASCTEAALRADLRRTTETTRVLLPLALKATAYPISRRYET
ncbi:MAG: hypothetical protein IPK60_25560 [Sandaracinaceae bacterium]|nr:hypothetical protein [Sandaracinaceae bacterium]